MTGFRAVNVHGVVCHSGDPTCDAAHQALLNALARIKTNFIPLSDSISNSQKGNLGEFISLHIARNGSFTYDAAFAHNAIQPLAKISGAGVDLMYVYFDPENENDDLLYIQETKTSGSTNNINYLDNLKVDYEKLFSTDINLTLQSRISYLCNSFEIERNQDDYARRVQRLGATKASACSNIRLIPTGIHEEGVGNPVEKMLAIRTAITTFGWSANKIIPWLVSLSDIEDRLLRLARGQS